MIQEATTSQNNRLTTIFFIVFVLLLALSSFLMQVADSQVTSYESIGIGILGRLVSFVIIVSWSISMIVLTIKNWKRLSGLSRMMGLSPVLFAPLFFILTFD